MATELIDQLLIQLSATRINNDIDELYQVVEMYGKGMGMIATRNINASTIILSESSLIRERKIENESEKYKLLIDSYNSLQNEYKQKQIMSLSNCFNCNSKREEMINIYYTNCIKIDNNKKYESGLFPNIARINHSCLPNAFWIYEDNVMTVRALFDIKKGEEICCCYLKPLNYTFKQRQEILFNKYGFKCKCNQCLNICNRNKEDEMIMKYRDLSSKRIINDIKLAIDILDTNFKGYPILKMNLLSRIADILIHQYQQNEDENKSREIYDECLKYIEKSILIGLQCYGDKVNNKSDWSETRKRIAILRWYSGDTQQKCSNLMDKYSYLF